MGVLGIRVFRDSGDHRSRCIIRGILSILVFSQLVASSYLHKIRPGQRFRRMPESTDAVLGAEALLRCEIDDQAGRAEWAKGGHLLGYMRNLPDFPRYSMDGHALAGIHNLKIKNVTWADEQVYECRVQPKPFNKALRAAAILNVITPPKSVEIVGQKHDRIWVREYTPTELECVARESRPDATITWYKDYNDEFKLKDQVDTREVVEIRPDGVPEPIELSTIRSKIKILPTRNNDRTKYTCTVNHTAWEEPKEVSVLLNVKYPPFDPPKILGFIAGNQVIEGKNITLTCESSGGNPLSELTWFKNNVRINSTQTEQNTVWRTSVIKLSFTATAEYNLTRIRCEAINSAMSTPKVSEVVMMVVTDLSNRFLTENAGFDDETWLDLNLNQSVYADRSKGMESWTLTIILVSVIGSIALILFIAVVVICIICKRRRRQRETQRDLNNETEVKGSKLTKNGHRAPTLEGRSGSIEGLTLSVLT